MAKMGSKATQEYKDQQQTEDERLLMVLGQLGGQRAADEDIRFEGDQLIVPKSWTAQVAYEHIGTYIEEMEEETEFTRTFRYRPMDGAHALQEALRSIFGAAGVARGMMTFFGRRPPTLVSVPTGPNSTAQVPWGMLQAPLIGGSMSTSVEMDEEYGPLFQLTVYTQRKFKAQVEGLFAAVEEQLRRGSIYKGKAINGATQPEFLDLRGVNEEKVIYSEALTKQLGANVWSLVKHSPKVRELGLPLKRAVLFEGDYGTGKTLGAFLTAKKCLQATPEPWTFVYCRPAKDDLETVLNTARLYQPAVVFFEDVDTIAAGGTRDHVSRLLDMFDGITAKGTELLCILTTNHPERIVKAMVRPGRLDAVLHFGEFDVPAVEKMVRANVKEHRLHPDLDFEAIADAMGVGKGEEAFLPAFVKESIDRTQFYALDRDGDVVMLTTQDFVESANGLRSQLDLMIDAGEGEGPERLQAAMEAVVGRTVHGVLSNTDVYREDRDEVFATLEPKGNGLIK